MTNNRTISFYATKQRRKKKKITIKSAHFKNNFISNENLEILQSSNTIINKNMGFYIQIFRMDKIYIHKRIILSYSAIGQQNKFVLSPGRFT